MSDRPHEPARSGWCLTRDHDRCVWSGCHCSCHYGTNANVVGAQGETRYAKGGNDERPPAVTEDRSSHSDSLTRREGVGS